MRGRSSQALESKLNRDIFQKEVWFLVFIGLAGSWQFYIVQTQTSFKEWSKLIFVATFIVGLLRGYGLVRRVWSPSRQSIARYSAALTCLEILVHVYIGQFTASRCTLFAHTSLDYALYDYDYNYDYGREPLSGFEETNQRRHCVVDPLTPSNGILPGVSSSDASPIATTPCTKCPMCWQAFYFGTSRVEGGKDVPDLIGNIHLWWMICFSLTPKGSLVAAAFKLVIFFSFPLIDWMKGTLSTVNCSVESAVDFEKLLALHGDRVMDFCFMYIVPILATAFLIQQRRVVLDKTALAVELLQLQEGKAIEEKLLRCSAEFQCDNLFSKIADCQSSEVTSYLGEEILPSGSCPPLEINQPATVRGYPTRTGLNRVKVPSSTKSAPTIMALHTGVASPSSMGCKNVGADCLPADAVAWVEHQPLPLPLSEVSAGDRVLCYDHLAQGPRYAEVSGIALETSVAEWVEVELEDGSRLGMTSDHPCHQATQSGKVVRASELQPGVDQLMVLKMVPVQVKSVVSMDVGIVLPPNETQSQAHARVALTVQNPTRYSVFVAASGQVPSMAVGSVDAPLFEEVIVKNTFLDVAKDDVQLFRSYSDPCMTKGLSLLTSPRDVRGVCGDSRQKSPQLSSKSSSSGTKASAPSNCSSLRTSLDSAADVPADDFTLKIPVQDESLDVVTSLSIVSSTLRSGFLSQGSAMHPSGACRPCVFSNKHRHNAREPACRNGLLCPYCHDEHLRTRCRRRRGTTKEEQISQSAPAQEVAISAGRSSPEADDMLNESELARNKFSVWSAV